MTNNEVKRMLSLRPSYNEVDKAHWKTASMKFLRSVVKKLGLPKGSYDLRFNAGGIAVSGDATLHTDTLYVQLNLDFCDWILARTCRGRKDYTGGRNCNYSYARLADQGVSGFVDWLRSERLVTSDEAVCW